jgi:hypothetical protein
MKLLTSPLVGCLRPLLKQHYVASSELDYAQDLKNMLELGGDAWTLNDGLFATEEGVYNRTVATSTGFGASGTGIVGACYRATLDGVGWNFDTSLFSTAWVGGNWSVACWVKSTELDPDASDMRFLVFSAYCDTGTPVAIDVLQPASSGTPFVRIYASDVGEANSVQRDTNITNNAWTLLTVVYTSSNRTMSVRLNGGPETTDVLPDTTSTDFSAETGAGIDSCLQYINGAGSMLSLFDELLVVPEALTLAQIEWLYNSGAGRSMSLLTP